MYGVGMHSDSWLLYFTVICVTLCTVSGLNVTYYCTDDGSLVDVRNTTGRIRTVYEGDNFYGNNLFCHWLLDAGAYNARVEVTVVQSHVQWAPENAICNGYDYMDIFDGADEDSPHLVSVCGTRNPRSVTSTGRYMYIMFSSNDRNPYQYKGITLDYAMFNTTGLTGSCPPGWHDDAVNAPDRNACYRVKTHKETWGSAQQYCNYDQANLVSLYDEEEADFVTELLKPELDEKEFAWIGLNDVRVEGVYEWIDETDTSKLQFRWSDTPHEPNRFWNCVVIRGSDWLWEEQFCTESEVQTLVKRAFVCKTLRFGNTTLYSLPPERPKDKNTSENNSAVTIIVGVLVGTVVLGGIIVTSVLCARKKSSSRERQRGQRSAASQGTEEVRMTSTNRQEPTAPPTYEEAMYDNK